MTKFNWQNWAKFGAAVGAITALVIVGLLTLGIGLIVPGVGSTPTVAVLLTTFGLILIISATIIGAVKWTVAGFVYDLFLDDYIKKYNIYWKLVSLSVVVSVLWELIISGGKWISVSQPGSFIMLIISSLIGIWFIVNIYHKVLKVQLPVSGGK